MVAKFACVLMMGSYQDTVGGAILEAQRILPTITTRELLVVRVLGRVERTSETKVTMEEP